MLAQDAASETVFSELAKAKVNLTLTVKGRRPDGYHELESIVVFASFGDALDFRPGAAFSLSVTGPMAGAIDGVNLIEKAVTLLAPALGASKGRGPGAFRLVKRIPVAAGLGGGSADAAAAIRALMRAHPERSLDEESVRQFAASVGADVPVCLSQRAAVMSGVGERLEPLPRLPSFPALLVNPGVKLATRDVFAALQAPPYRENAGQPRATPPSGEAGALRAYLLASGNDLEKPALALAPEVGATLSALRASPGCWLARLSGSGPTCFGLFDAPEEATAARERLLSAHPSWWALATTLNEALKA